MTLLCCLISFVTGGLVCYIMLAGELDQSQNVIMKLIDENRKLKLDIRKYKDDDS